MKLKNILCLTALCAAVMASAQAGEALLIKGRGQANNADQQKARFIFEVGKTNNGQVKGKFVLTTLTDEGRPKVVLTMTRPGELTKNGIIAILIGLCRAEVNTPNGVEHYEGQLTARVIDERQPNDPPNNRRDKIAVEFKVRNSDRVFRYEGIVRDGDIVVRG